MTVTEASAQSVPPDTGEETIRSAVRACRAGDADAFRTVVECHEQWILRLMTRFSHDPATVRELAQDVFVQAWLSLSGYRETGDFGAWLRTVAVRTGYRHWRDRHRRRTRETPLTDEMRAALAAPESAPLPEAASALHAVLDRLDPKDRLVVVLYYMEGQSTRDIAVAAGWSHTLVRVRLHRARARLRTMLKDAAGVPEEDLGHE